jgi:hypothetical protein
LGQCCAGTAAAANAGAARSKLQMPSWGGSDTGWMAMPYDQMAPVPMVD